jgi:geranylgeranyl diphosphate synthase type II
MNKQENNSDFSLEVYLKNKREFINKILLTIISQFDNKRELISAMKYSLMANGKRLRPILCIASAECINGPDKSLSQYAILPACAIEMIHTYSLIHDDLPAMDDDDLRRGKPTLHKKFSEATAILAGDALLTHAFSILSNSSIFSFRPISDDILLKIIGIIADASGVNGMVEGQILDMNADLELSAKNNSESLKYLEKMHALKTGKMIQASIEIGAITACADKDQLNSLIFYAKKIGMAFQIIDDILDIEGDSLVLGKPVGSDVGNRKLTFPEIIGLEESKKYAQKLITDALEALEKFGEKALPLQKIANYIIQRNH